MTPQETYDICMKCGAICCKYQLTLMIDRDDTEQIKYWEARADKRIRTPKGNLYLFKSVCRSLLGTRCTLHDTDRYPQYCKDYPFVNTHDNWKYLCKLLQRKE